MLDFLSRFNPYYLGFWIAGLVGVIATSWALLHSRNQLTLRNALPAILSVFGFVYFRQVHFRLELLPPGQALAIPLGELFQGGGRVPLGIAGGIAVGAVAALLSRGSFLLVLDSISAGWAMKLGLVRIGCFMANCCTGPDCHDWPSILCTKYPRGSEAFVRQHAAGTVSLAASTSLPVHPLPMYFSTAGFAIAILLLWRFRRGDRPGTLLSIFLCLYPASQLALEQLRAVPGSRSPEWMTGTLLALLLVGIAVGTATLRTKGS